MANTKSAIKRTRSTTRRKLYNKMIKSSLKTALKNFELSLQSEDKSDAAAKHTIAVSKLDRAAAKGVIHKNAASRKKAQLAKNMLAAK